MRFFFKLKMSIGSAMIFISKTFFNDLKLVPKIFDAHHQLI